MPRVMFGLSNHEIGREERGVSFDVLQDDESKLGTLTVSKGGLRWRPQYAKGEPYMCDWQEFDKFMRDFRRR
jgi:hypothetical protein